MLKKSYPLVTVFTLIYNTNPEFVIEAIESVRSNTYPNLEHIVIDDFSTNGYSKEKINEWIIQNKYECEFIEHKYNYGLCKTLNHVLELAKGKYLIGCSDDILLSDSIQNQVELLEKNENAGMSFGKVILLDEKKDYVLPLKLDIEEFLAGTKFMRFNQLVDKNFIMAFGCLIRISIIRSLGNFDENLGFEDYDMWLRILKTNEILYNNKLLGYYRVHNMGLNTTHKDWTYDYLKIFIKHIDYSKNCVKKIESLANDFYLNNHTEALGIIKESKIQSIKLKFMFFLQAIHFPKKLGYKILWRV